MRRIGSETGSRLHWCRKLFFPPFFNSPNLSGAVDVENTFNVVDLVLEDPRQPSFGSKLKILAVSVQALDGDSLVSLDFAKIPRER